MKGKRLLFYCIVVFSIFQLRCVPVFAQNPGGIFEHSTLFIYNQDKELPQNSIEFMCFDKWGFLWVATTDGLARFDGRSFKVYPQQSKNTMIGGFVKLTEDTLLAFPYRIDKMLIITKGSVNGLVNLDKEKYGYPLYTSFCSIPYPVAAKAAYPLFSGILTIDDIFKYSSYAGFRCGKDSFALVYNDTLKIFSIQGMLGSITIPNLNSNVNRNFTVLNKTPVYLDNSEKCIVLYDLKGNAKKLALPYSNQYNWALYRGENERQFFLENEGKLYQVEQNKNTGNVIYTLLLNNFKAVQVSMIINRNNTILIAATLDNGLYVYKKNKAQTFTDTSHKNINNAFYSQVLLPDNKTVVTGRNKLFNEKGFVNVLPALRNIQQRVMYKDSYKNYWYQKNDSFIYRTPQLSGSSTNYLFNSYEMHYFFEDSKKNIWISGDKFWGYFKPGSNTYIDVNYFKDGVCADSIGRIYTIAENKDGIFLLGGSKGIFSFNPDRPRDGFKPYAINDIEVRHIEIDKVTGHVWVGTKGKGICSIKDGGKTVLYFPQDKYGNMRTVHFFLTDYNGMTWISTNNGLFVTTQKSLSDFDRLSSGNLFYFKFTKNDGLNSNEFDGACQNPMLLLPDSTLTASSINGLVWIKTNDFINPFSVSPFFLEHTDKGIDSLFDNGSTLYLDHTQNTNVTLTLSFADWNEDFNIETGYRFGNSSDTANLPWQALNSDNKIIFPYLSTGDYYLTVRKRNGFGATDYIYTSVVIKVTPRWYETKWFYILLLLPLLLLIQLIVYIRNRQLKKANTLLTRRVAEATEQLQDTNLQLSELNETKDSLITMFNHDLSVPLFYVSQMLAQISYDKQLKGTFPAIAEDITIMSSTMSDLNVLMNDMLLWIKMQQHNFTLEIQDAPVDTLKLIDRTLQLFQFRIDSNDINITKEIEQDIVIKTDERLFSSILYNVISNAIKFTRTGFLNIRMFREAKESNKFLLIFENSTPAKENAYTKDDTAAGSHSANTEAIQSRGIGLMLVEDFIAMLGFTITYRFNETGVFTVVIKGGIDKPDVS